MEFGLPHALAYFILFVPIFVRLSPKKTRNKRRTVITMHVQSYLTTILYKNQVRSPSFICKPQSQFIKQTHQMKIFFLAVLLLTLSTSNCLTIHHQAQRNITGNFGNTLYPGESLKEGDYLSSGNGYTAKMQDDGNFVLYNGDEAVWSTQTDNKGVAPRRLTLQSDGNAVIYDADNTPIWSSGTDQGEGNGQFELVLQDDRNLVIYAKNPLWSTSTNL